MSKETMKLALEALDIVKIHFTQNRHVNDAITALREALAKPDFWEGYEPEPVKPAPEAGFPASEQQKPVFSYTPDMDAVRRAEKEKADKFLAHLAQQALDKKAENARELGLDYEPSTGTQVSKVWWDGEKLMAKPIPFVEFYKPAQRTWVGLSDAQSTVIWANSQSVDEAIRATEKQLMENNK